MLKRVATPCFASICVNRELTVKAGLAVAASVAPVPIFPRRRFTQTVVRPNLFPGNIS